MFDITIEFFYRSEKNVLNASVCLLFSVIGSTEFATTFRSLARFCLFSRPASGCVSKNSENFSTQGDNGQGDFIRGVRSCQESERPAAAAAAAVGGATSD